jgi:hypothetical protein
MSTKEILEKNQIIRDRCLDWLVEIAEGKKTGMLGMSSNSITQMYYTACKEVTRMEAILDAKAMNNAAVSGYSIMFQDSQEADEGEQLHLEA